MSASSSALTVFSTAGGASSIRGSTKSSPTTMFLPYTPAAHGCAPDRTPAFAGAGSRTNRRCRRVLIDLLQEPSPRRIEHGKRAADRLPRPIIQPRLSACIGVHRLAASAAKFLAHMALTVGRPRRAEKRSAFRRRTVAGYVVGDVGRCERLARRWRKALRFPPYGPSNSQRHMSQILPSRCRGQMVTDMLTRPRCTRSQPARRGRGDEMQTQRASHALGRSSSARPSQRRNQAIGKRAEALHSGTSAPGCSSCAATAPTCDLGSVPQAGGEIAAGSVTQGTGHFRDVPVSIELRSGSAARPRYLIRFGVCAMTSPDCAARATHRPRAEPLRKFAAADRPEDLSCARSCQWSVRVAGF